MIFHPVWKLFMSRESYERRWAREQEIRKIEREKRGGYQCWLLGFYYAYRRVRMLIISIDRNNKWEWLNCVDLSHLFNYGTCDWRKFLESFARGKIFLWSELNY